MGRGIFVLLVVVLASCTNEDVLLGDRLFKSGDYKQAVEAYTEYLALKPDHIKSIYNRGRSYEELGQFARAEADFQHVLKLDPNHMQARLSISNGMYRNRQFEDVIYQTTLVLEETQNANAYLLRARAYQKTGKLKDAMADYNSAIALNDELGEAYFYRGTLKIYGKRKAAACADFKIAESLDIQAAKKARKDYCN